MNKEFDLTIKKYCSGKNVGYTLAISDCETGVGIRFHGPKFSSTIGIEEFDIKAVQISKLLEALNFNNLLAEKDKQIAELQAKLNKSELEEECKNV